MKLKQYLEELLGIDNFQGKLKVAYQINPTEMFAIMPWARGIILPSGDIVVAHYKALTPDDYVIHEDIVGWCNENLRGFNSGYGKEDYKDPATFINDFISVQRKNRTNIFLLGESYSNFSKQKFKEKFKEYKQVFEKKNPTLFLDI